MQKCCNKGIFCFPSLLFFRRAYCPYKLTNKSAFRTMALPVSFQSFPDSPQASRSLLQCDIGGAILSLTVGHLSVAVYLLRSAPEALAGLWISIFGGTPNEKNNRSGFGILDSSTLLVSCSIRNPGTVEAVAESQIPPEDLRSASTAFPVGSSDIFAFRGTSGKIPRRRRPYGLRYIKTVKSPSLLGPIWMR